MQIKFKEVCRKDLVKAIGEVTGAKIIYKGPPTFFYESDYFTVDRDCNLNLSDLAETEVVEDILKELETRGFMAEETFIKTEANKEEARFMPSAADVTTTRKAEDLGLTIALPMEKFTPESWENLNNLLAAKGVLIKKALDLEKLPEVIEKDGKALFHWFDKTPKGAETVRAYNDFICALAKMARTQKKVSPKEKKVENEKYTFRCFLLRLGFIGDEYKTSRKILLKNLSGSSSFSKLGGRA